MNHFKRSFVIHKPVDQVFKALSDVEEYKTFIPYCFESKIIEEHQNYSLVSLSLEFIGIQTSLTTKNVVKDNKSIEMDLIDGPFEEFKSSWRIQEIDEYKTNLNFEMTYKIKNKLLEIAFKKNLKTASESIIRAFKSKI